MDRKKLLMLLPIMCCTLLSSCGQEGMGSGTQPAAESEWEQEPASQTTEGPTVLGDILGIQPEELEHFSYYDTPKLSESDGVAFPVEGAGAITFVCGNEPLYRQEQAAFTVTLAQALSEYRVGGQWEVAHQESPLPAGRYFSLWPTLQSGWNPVLTFFDSGEIYVYVNGGLDGVDRYWQSENPAQFDELLAVLEEIHGGLNALPLDYQLSMWLRHDSFKPESEALRITFKNSGKDVVTAEPFLLERKTEDGWEQIGEVPAADLAIAPHQENTRYAIDLTAIPNAREPGDYRVTGNLKAGSETLPLELPYTIDEDAEALSSLPIPEMTPENQDYCERYVGMWGMNSPFVADFDEDNYIRVSHPFHLYRSMAYAEGKGDAYDREYGIHVPGEILEDMILRHFLFTAEQIRAWMPTQEINENEYYDPQENIYHFEGGYGGVGYTAVVSANSRDGDRLTLACDWYDYEDRYRFSQELTLRLGEGESDFVYVAGRMLDDLR